MKQIVVTYREEEGSVWADSADLDGFVAVGETLEEVRGLVFEGLPFYLEDDDLTIFEEWEDHRPIVVLEPRRTGYRMFDSSHTAAAVGTRTVSRLTRVRPLLTFGNVTTGSGVPASA
jgi:predicted RNase H-like HicB family nuclease